MRCHPHLWACNIGCLGPPLHKTWPKIISEHHESHPESCQRACNIGCSGHPVYKTWEIIISEHHEYHKVPYLWACNIGCSGPDFFAYRKTRPKIISECHESHQVPYLSTCNIGCSFRPTHLHCNIGCSFRPTHLQQNIFTYKAFKDGPSAHYHRAAARYIKQDGWMDGCGDRETLFFWLWLLAMYYPSTYIDSLSHQVPDLFTQ
jgi:hypothetical protein